jgi:hypothetical protein
MHHARYEERKFRDHSAESAAAGLDERTGNRKPGDESKRRNIGKEYGDEQEEQE